MKRWFSGRLTGHYVGRPRAEVAGPHALPGGERFAVEIYRAVVRDIALLGDEPEAGAGAEAGAVSEAGSESGSESQSEAGSVSESESVTEAASEAASESESECVSVSASEAEAEAAFAAESASEAASMITIAPSAKHHVPEGPAMHQPHIAQVYFIDAHGPGRTVLAAAYDVLISETHFSHPARHGGQTYGRVEARVSGWFRPPPPGPEPETVEPPADAPAPVWASREVLTGQPQPPTARPVGPGQAATAVQNAGASTAGAETGAEPSTRATAAEQTRDPATAEHAEHADGAMAPPHPPIDLPMRDSLGFEPEPEVAPEPPPPELADPVTGGLPLLAVFLLMALALAIAGAPGAAALWCGCFLPLYGIRRWLTGVIPDGGPLGLFAVLTAFGEVALSTMTILGWFSDGCRALSVLPLLVLMAGAVITTFLPRPYAFAACLLSFGAVLGAYYGPFGLPVC